MSERASFVTEYIYCEACFEKAKEVLLSKEKYLCSQAIDSWSGNEKSLPIIAGKWGTLNWENTNEEFKKEVLSKLEDVICHPVRVAFLGENDETIFLVTPRELVEKQT